MTVNDPSNTLESDEFDKENLPPPFATPIGKPVPASATPVHPGSHACSGTRTLLFDCYFSVVNQDTETPSNKPTFTPSSKTGEAPKTLDQWDKILRSLPMSTAADRVKLSCQARLERLFERVLGSGSGTEELEISSHKDNEGLLSGDKAYKPIQEGKENGAQPVSVLDDLLKSGGDGKPFQDVCHEVLKSYPEVRSMLSLDKKASGSTQTAPPVQEPKEDTVVFQTKVTIQTPGVNADKTPKVAKKAAIEEKEETVVFSKDMHGSASKGTSLRSRTETESAKSDGKPEEKKSSSIRRGALRSVKRTGLGAGPARRVCPNEAVAEDEEATKTVDPVEVSERTSEKTLEHSAESAEIPPSSKGIQHLPPITEQEGRSSSEGNNSISSGTSNDSVNRTLTQEQNHLSDMPTQPIDNGKCGGSPSFSDLPTQPQPSMLGSRPSGRIEREVEEVIFRPLASSMEAEQARVQEVPKGYISVNSKLYKKIEVKGKGGGGKVYKVHLKDDPNSIWAIKKIKLEGDEELRVSVQNEIDLLIALRGQPSIIHMEDYEIGDDLVYMVMECGEQDLAQALHKRQVRSLRGVWKAMLEAVQVVHEQRVVHGDLKPANFLMVNKELKAITDKNHNIDFPAMGPSAPVEKELKQHPWLVPPKFALDSYNILVMVSKVRALHRENPERTDEDIKELLIPLMEAAGLAIKEPPAPPASKSVPSASAAPPPPPPPPAAAPPAPPPPAALPSKPCGQQALAPNSSAGIRSTAPPPPPPQSHSSSCGLGVSAAEVLAQRHKLKKVEPAPRRQRAAEAWQGSSGI
ncbi:hypothetical protein GUITHDRAFT_136848 [Guillardia theta CCMP2712]|uniref:Protein kinase domain-containing protein n=1 Tax=Guillardia theta (strain CCMP2712) TaxID=905079 RepID=L1JIJ8_GUITC|nr:hypothetical protein GUITHDRAFT_136848 [Guillardia theta CCMP2712]EKX48338.1 hypothetical protein GUITHDRAFT_136848 [Guillardia theta CCMP2712]|eukprot:XP_005835318.1 hypothetical protein GUITHDRAFT_136848 [Guillardia theta CCMP2712]